MMAKTQIWSCQCVIHQTTGTLCFYSEDEATNFNGNIADANNFKSYKSKLIRSAAAATGILEKANHCIIKISKEKFFGDPLKCHLLIAKQN